MIRITACYEKGVELGDDEFLVMMMMVMVMMMMMMMMICSITNIDPSTIVVQRVLSLDDGSERAEEPPRFKSWPSRCSPIR